MGTVIRPEVTEKSEYWINKHRYYELKHFCMQYPIWKKAYASLTGLSKRPDDLVIFSKVNGDPTERCVEAKEFYFDRILMVEKAAMRADPIIGPRILDGVIHGLSYDKLRARKDIPCSKDEYYHLYRKFFWNLHIARN